MYIYYINLFNWLLFLIFFFLFEFFYDVFSNPLSRLRCIWVSIFNYFYIFLYSLLSNVCSVFQIIVPKAKPISFLLGGAVLFEQSLIHFFIIIRIINILFIFGVERNIFFWAGWSILVRYL